MTKQTLATLCAIGKDTTDRQTLAKRLGIPYTSACGRIKRMVRDGRVDAGANGAITLTPAGLAELYRRGWTYEDRNAMDDYSFFTVPFGTDELAARARFEAARGRAKVNGGSGRLYCGTKVVDQFSHIAENE